LARTISVLRGRTFRITLAASMSQGASAATSTKTAGSGPKT